MKTPYVTKDQGKRIKDENRSGIGSEFILYPLSFIL
jgi:hypothetical protein